MKDQETVLYIILIILKLKDLHKRTALHALLISLKIVSLFF